MKLLTKANLAELPPLYTHENTPADQVPVAVKFFTPDSNWTWYATEYDPAEGRIAAHTVVMARRNHKM